MDVQIYIKRDDGQFGPFTPQQIEECLANGSLIGTDIAWHAALPDWVPVTEVLGTLESATAPAQAAPSPAPAKQQGGRKKMLIAAVAGVVVLGAAAAVVLPKVLSDGDGAPDENGEGAPPKAAVKAGTNQPPPGVADQASGTNASNNLSVPLAPSGPSSTSFNAVTQHLDTGGVFYFYLSTDEAQGWVKSGLDEGGKLLQQFAPMLGADGAGQAAMGLAAAKALYTGIGLDAIDGLGASTRSLGDGLKRNVAMVHRDPAKGAGILWKAFGREPYELDALSLMPAETVYAYHGDLDLAALLAWAKTMAEDNLPPAAAEPLDAMLAQPPVKQALGAYGGQIGVYMTLDFQKMLKIPKNGAKMDFPGGGQAVPGGGQAVPGGGQAVPGSGLVVPGGEGEALEIPEPGLIIVIKVKNGDLLTKLQGFAESMDFPLAEVNFGGLKTHQFPQPMPVPEMPGLMVQPVVFQSGGYLVLASSPALAAKVIATQANQQAGLSGTAEFQKLARGLELKGNQFTFMSGKVKSLYTDILKTSMAAEADTVPEPLQDLLVKFMTLGMSGQVTVVQVLPEGFLLRTQTEGMGYDTALLAVSAVVPVAVVGITAGLALPALTGARHKAREAQSMNNIRQLAIAVQLYHEEHEALPDAANWSDTLLPLLDNDRQIFNSPNDPDAEGSSYAYNKNLSGVKLDTLEAAARTVVFFESDLGWNGAGGRDDAFTLGDDYLIGFADGHVERVSEDDLDKLTWNP